MEGLLEPSPGSAAAAVVACRRALVASGLPWRAALVCVPVERRADVAVVLAWQRLLHVTLDAESDGPRRAAALERARAEARAVATGRCATAVGRALSITLPRIGLAPTELLPPLDERARREHVSAFETRDALLVHVRRIAHPAARALLAALGRTDERDRLRAESLANALFLTQRWIHLRREIEGGRLYLPVDEALAEGAELSALMRGETSAGLRRALAQATGYTRGYYVKGWPLVRVFGPVRARALAFLLRWHAASLAGLENRGFDPTRGAPPAGLLRFGACLVSALASPEPPPL